MPMRNANPSTTYVLRLYGMEMMNEPFQIIILSIMAYNLALTTFVIHLLYKKKEDEANK